MFEGINHDINIRYGFDCSNPAASLPLAASTLNLAVAPQIQDGSLEEFDRSFRIFRQSMSSSPENTYLQAEYLTDVLSQSQRLSDAHLRSVVDVIAPAAFEHMQKGESLPALVRYNSNLSTLIRLIVRSGSESSLRSARNFVSDVLLRQSPEERDEDFRLRRSTALAFWDATNIAILYWDDFLDLSPSGRAALQDHYSLLNAIIEAGSDFPPGRKYLRMLIVRDDVGATAGEGLLWLPPRASYRAFIHESGHVIHLTDPAVRDAFASFERLHAMSSEGDFFTDYHTDAQEDFAEMYTELVSDENVQAFPMDTAIKRYRSGKPLMLQKILFFIDTFGSSLNAYVRKQDGVIQAIHWRGETYGL